MQISSRTPEGEPQRCPLCGTVSVLEPCAPLGDAVCPACGILIVLRKHRGDWVTRETMWKELGADSLDTVELVMELEEEFDISIPDDEAEQIQTIGDLIDWIERHRAQEDEENDEEDEDLDANDE